MISQDS